MRAPSSAPPSAPPSAAVQGSEPARRSRRRRRPDPLTWSRAALDASGNDHAPRSHPRGRTTGTTPSRRRPQPAPREERGTARRSTRRRIYGSAAALVLAAMAFRAGSVVSLAIPLGGATVLLAVRVTRRRAKQRQRAALAEAAPAAIDLLSACLLAGLNPHLGIQRVAERCPEALRAELGRVAADLDLGRSPAAALRAASERTGLDELRAAAAALDAAERWGMPPSEALAARAEALRIRARLAAEADAGRAGVRLAFPLVLCFLPAFVLLTVIPTMAGALHALAP